LASGSASIKDVQFAEEITDTNKLELLSTVHSVVVRMCTNGSFPYTRRLCNKKCDSTRKRPTVWHKICRLHCLFTFLSTFITVYCAAISRPITLHASCHWHRHWHSSIINGNVNLYGARSYEWLL